MRDNNQHIKERTPSTNETLREDLHKLKVGETLITRDKDAPRLAASLSRATKRVSGTRLAVRTLPNTSFEIQLIKHYETNPA